MKPDYNLCDICHEKTTTRGIFFRTGRESDGVENVDTGPTYDLCPAHAREALGWMADRDYDDAKALVEWVKKRVKK